MTASIYNTATSYW